MDKPEPARNPEFQTPDGRLFLCLRQSIPSFIIEKLPFMEEIKQLSMDARKTLSQQQAQWDADAQRGAVGAYLSEVAIMMGGLRPQTRELQERILKIDELTLLASTYADICAAVRSTTREVAGRFGQLVPAGRNVQIGEHYYATITSCDGYSYFIRQADDYQVFFDAPGLGVSHNVRHAQTEDHLQLYRDIAGGELFCAPPNIGVRDVI